MKNTKNTFIIRETKKDKQIKKLKRMNKIFLVITIIAVLWFLSSLFQNFVNEWTQTKGNQVNWSDAGNFNLSGNLTINQTAVNQGTGGGIAEVISSAIGKFMDKLFTYPGGFWTKFFIFLGIIYLIQIAFTLLYDIVELALVFFVLIKRSVVFTYRKIKGIKKEE